MKNQKKSLPIKTTVSDKIKKGAVCAACRRELAMTSGDAVWLESGDEKFRVCYEHILKLTSYPGSVIPAAPKNIKRFDPGDFLSSIKALEERDEKILRNFLEKEPVIRNFVEKLR